jgi:long-subunit fatty acid transport protein
MLSIPLIGKEIKAKVPFVTLQDEIMINAGKNIVYNYFDQNRVYIGVGYAFSDDLSLQIGYSNIFQQKPVGNQFIVGHALRVSLYHSLDLRKKAD